MKKIGVCNNKGGVGKTTISLCLAGAFSEMDLKVLLVDMDQQGSLSSSFLRLDPIVPFEGWRDAYSEMIRQIFSKINPKRITLGR